MPVIGAIDLAEEVRRRAARFGDPTEEQLAREHVLIQRLREDADSIVDSFCSPTTTSTSLSQLAQTFICVPEEVLLSDDANLRVFLWHATLDKVPPLPVRAPVQNDASERAWACFTALSNGRFLNKLAENAAWRRRYLDAWPGLFKWSQYFFEQRVACGGPDADDAQRILLELLYSLVLRPDLERAIRATPGIIKLAGQYWGRRYAPGDARGRSMELFAALIMPHLMMEATFDELDEFCFAVTAGSDDPKPVARLAMGRLKRAMPASPDVLLQRPFCEELYAHSFAVVMLTRLPGHATTPTLLQENATWAMTSALLSAARALDLPGGAQSARVLDCVNGGITFLRYALIREDSYRWVCQALDAGLLEAVASLSLFIERMGHGRAGEHLRECLRHIIHDSLAKHMVYKSVIRIARREVDEVPPALVRERMMNSYLKDDWVALGNLVELRSKIADLEIQKRGVVSCDSLSCHKSGKKSQLKRCAGCQYVYYCSKECQAAMWPNHKRMCKLKNEMNGRNGPDMRLSFLESDAAFFRKLFGADAHAHMPHLRRLAKRDFPREPGEHFVICIDYTDPAHPAGTCSLKNIHTYQFQTLTGREYDTANVDGQNQEMITMVRRDPRAFTFIEATFAKGEFSTSRNLMIRPNLWHQADSSLEHALNWQQHDSKFQCPNARHGLPSLLENMFGDLLDMPLEDDEDSSEWESEDEDEDVQAPPPQTRSNAAPASTRTSGPSKAAGSAARLVVDPVAERFETLRMADID